MSYALFRIRIYSFFKIVFSSSEKDGLFFTETKESLELREKWQRKLYSAIFHRHGNEKSLLEHVFEEETGRTDENKEYDTIPFLFKACENGNFNLDKLPKDDGKALIMLLVPQILHFARKVM